MVAEMLMSRFGEIRLGVHAIRYEIICPFQGYSMKIALQMLFTLLILVFTAPALGAKIVSSDRSFYISSASTGVDFDIKSTNGDVLYNFRCYNGGHIDSDEIEYFGAFQCMLFAVNPDSIDLFEEIKYDWSTRWRTRGMFSYEQMVGPCMKDNAYGINRKMHVRDLHIELSLTEIKTPSMIDMIKGEVPAEFSANLNIKVSESKEYNNGAIQPIPKKYCAGSYTVDSSGNGLIYTPY
jgi:hypothetical protein